FISLTTQACAAAAKGRAKWLLYFPAFCSYVSRKVLLHPSNSPPRARHRCLSPKAVGSAFTKKAGYFARLRQRRRGPREQAPPKLGHGVNAMDRARQIIESGVGPSAFAPVFMSAAAIEDPAQTSRLSLGFSCAALRGRAGSGPGRSGNKCPKRCSSTPPMRKKPAWSWLTATKSKNSILKH